MHGNDGSSPPAARRDAAPDGQRTVLSRTRVPAGPPDAKAVEDLLEQVLYSADTRFERIRGIAESGMSAIDEVRDRTLRRRTARKTIHEKLQRDPLSVRFFLREAQITSQLDHPTIVPVHDIGLDADGHLYFTLKLIRGRTLAEIIEALPPGPIAYEPLLALLEAVSRVCDALGFAHSRGVFHCDIKPANVMVGDFGETYLMDWGVARSLDPEIATDPPPRGEIGEPAAEASDAFGHACTGTPAYMAPEHTPDHPGPLGPHTDVFGVGALLYEILARRAPYAGLEPEAAMERARECRFPPLHEVAPPECVPAGLRRIVERAMDARPEARYQGIGELRREIVQFTRGGGAFPRADFAAGHVIVREGERGESAYIIRAGRCGVYRDVAGQPVLVQTLGPGEVFGETAILSPGPRIASVVALDDVSAQLVTGGVLTQEVETMHPWMGTFIRALADRFRQVTGAPGGAGSDGDREALARRAFAHLCTFGEPGPDGRLAMGWSRLCAGIGVEPLALGAALEAHPGFRVDAGADRVVLEDLDSLRERLRPP